MGRKRSCFEIKTDGYNTRCDTCQLVALLLLWIYYWTIHAFFVVERQMLKSSVECHRTLVTSHETPLSNLSKECFASHISEWNNQNSFVFHGWNDEFVSGTHFVWNTFTQSGTCSTSQYVGENNWEWPRCWLSHLLTLIKAVSVTEYSPTHMDGSSQPGSELPSTLRHLCCWFLLARQKHLAVWVPVPDCSWVSVLLQQKFCH